MSEYYMIQNREDIKFNQWSCTYLKMHNRALEEIEAGNRPIIFLAIKEKCGKTGEFTNTSEWQRLQELEKQVEDLESELKEYKRCAVVGGDGKPIKVGDTVYFLSRVTWEASSSVVKCIEQTSKGIIVRDSHGGSAHPASDCFSSADAVPGGEQDA